MTFDADYYDFYYFADKDGKTFRRPDGSVDKWGYRNLEGYWDGCHTIAKAWKEIFKLEKCDTDTGLCKACDVGCGRGPFVWALRNVGVECWGFDFSGWAIENRYKGCENGWTIIHDATKGWPYGNNSFDLTISLDLMEHIYSENLDFVIGEMYRTSKKWIFLQIAVCGSGGLQGESGFQGYILKKGENIPVELEPITVAGHVTVQPRQFWIDKLNSNMNSSSSSSSSSSSYSSSSSFNNQFRYRDDLVQRFIELVPENVITNWVKNAIIIMERV